MKLESALSKLKTQIAENKTFTITETKNKGIVGHQIETLLGIPHTSNCLDCEDGEIKAFPMKTLKDGTMRPKETVAVTMVSPSSLSVPFEEHRVGKKLQNTLFVPYLQKENTVELMDPFIYNSSNSKHKELERDYNQIVESYNETGRFQSSNGKYLQTRTKGAKNSDTRAFYLRKNFLEEVMQSNSKSSPSSL